MNPELLESLSVFRAYADALWFLLTLGTVFLVGALLLVKTALPYLLRKQEEEQRLRNLNNE